MNRSTALGQVDQEMKEDNMSDFTEAVKRLKELHARITTDTIEAGRIISEFATSVKRGAQTVQMKRLAKKAGIAWRTAYNYVSAYKTSLKLGPRVLKAASKAGLNVNRKPVLEKPAEGKALNPKASAEEIAKFAKSAPARNPKLELVLTPKQRQEKLFQFAQKLYWNVNPAQRDRELRELADTLIDLFRLEEPEKSQVA